MAIQIIANAVKAILDSPADDQRRTYAKALRDSLTWDRGRDDAKPESPEDIASTYDLPMATLYELYIVLDREHAVKLLDDLRYKISEASFKKKYNGSYHHNKLGRPPSRHRGFVYTYAEVLFLADYKNPVSFPEELKILLKNG